MNNLAGQFVADRPPVRFGNAHQHCKQSHQFTEQLRAWVAMEIIYKEDIKYTFLCHLSQIVISKLEVITIGSCPVAY